MVVHLPSSLSLSTGEDPGELGGERMTTRVERAQLDLGFFEIQNEKTKSWRFWALYNLKRMDEELVILGSGFWVLHDSKQADEELAILGSPRFEMS
ncbi:hypothetical protein ACFX1S_040091 [Malus domestica]